MLGAYIFGFGASAAIATIFISFNNPRAILWVTLGSLKVLVCSIYVQISFPNGNIQMPDPFFVTLIFTAIFYHLLEKYRVFEWELVLQRLVFLSLFTTAAKFLNVPVVSQAYGPLNTVFYVLSFCLIFANSLCKAGLLKTSQIKGLNRFLKSIGANSKQLEKKKGWAQRWY